MDQPRDTALRPKICFVDDESELIEIYAGHFSDFFDVRTYNSPTLALADFDLGYRPEVIVTDLRMPDIDGFRFVDLIKSREINAPVIVLSGYADKQSALKAIEKGVFRFLEKPFNLKTLRSVLDEANSALRKSSSNVALLETYFSLTGNLMELVDDYQERYQTAENLLYASGIPLRQTKKDVEKFLAVIKRERTIAEKIAQLSLETRTLNTTIGKKKT